MQSIITKIELIICYSLVLILFVNCKKVSDFENQITITINSIDKKTKQRRINMFDNVVVRKEGIGFLKKTFNKVGEYVTDAKGSVKIQIDASKICDISVSGLNVLGGDMFYPGNLNDGQEINIEVFSIN